MMSSEGGSDVLLVGEGNFSFSAALSCDVATETDDITRRKGLRITATCLQTREEALRHLGSAHNIHTVTQTGGEVLFEVDATRLPDRLGGRQFDRVIFNFPHCGRKSGVQKNRALLKHFFLSCVEVLKEEGEVLLSLCNGQGGTPADQPMREWHNSWQVVVMAAEAGLILNEVRPFDSEKLLGYKSTGYRSQDKSFHAEHGVTHVFSRSVACSTPRRTDMILNTVGGDTLTYHIPAELSNYINRGFLCSGSVHPVRLVQDFLVNALKGEWPVSIVTEPLPLIIRSSPQRLTACCPEILDTLTHCYWLHPKHTHLDQLNHVDTLLGSLTHPHIGRPSGKHVGVREGKEANRERFLLRPSMLPQMEELLGEQLEQREELLREQPERREELLREQSERREELLREQPERREELLREQPEWREGLLKEQPERREELLREQPERREELLKEQPERREELLREQPERREELLKEQTEWREELLREQPERREELLREQPERREELLREQPEWREELLREQPEQREELLKEQLEQREELLKEQLEQREVLLREQPERREELLREQPERREERRKVLHVVSGLVLQRVPISPWAPPAFHQLLLRGECHKESITALGRSLERLLASYGVSLAKEQGFVWLIAEPMGRLGWLFSDVNTDDIILCLNLDLLASLLYSVPDWRILWSSDHRFLNQFLLRPLPGQPFCPFSLFPRSFVYDISFWTWPDWQEAEFHAVVREASEETVEDVTLIDAYTPPANTHNTDLTSYCYRLTYRSHTHALSHTRALKLHAHLQSLLSKCLSLTVR